MERLALKSLEKWATQDDHKPLILTGARQTGKTWLVQNFSAQSRRALSYVNFERDPELADCFSTNDPHTILGLLEARLRATITPGKTLLFLDEIQAKPELLAKLRWFSEEVPNLHVIAAGSLLDFALADHSFSMPVGRVTYGNLEPMNFVEFLLAVGEERLVTTIRSATPTLGVPAVLHSRLSELSRTYALIGGMPAAVAEWAKTRSYQLTASVHRDLLRAIRDDFAKYSGNREKIAKVFAALPRLVGRKFQPRKVDSEEKTLPLRNAFRMLSLARIATPVRRTSANGLPLGAEVDEQYEKVCLLDVGLYSTLSGLDALDTTKARDLTLVNEGQLAEQWVGQELRGCRPFNQEPELFTWVREAKSSSAEVDYVIQVGTRIVPIEVKAGSTGRLRSLHVMVAEKKLDLAVRVSSEPLQLTRVSTVGSAGNARQFWLLSIPFYLTSELPRLIKDSLGA